MITLTIDKGASFTKAVLWNKQKIIKFFFNQQLPKADKIIRVTPKIEFDCLGKGGLYLSGLKSAIVVSCGTGTAVVWARQNKDAVHLGGTGVGGGTLQGLAKLILKTDSVDKIFEWAKKGQREKVDLTVGDILGTGIGLLNPETTAANFGKLKSKNKADLAQALVNMVGEVIGMTACLAAGKTKEKKIVFCGMVATNKLMQKYIAGVCEMFQLEAIFPKHGEYATAIGTCEESPCR